MPQLGEVPRDRSGSLPTFNIRLTLEVNTSLRKAAAVERRTISSMVDVILAKWLVAHGYLDDTVEHPKKP